MKRTLKTIIAVILAAIIAAGSISAFAAEEKITLDFYGDKYEYISKGTLAEGENNLSVKGDNIFLYYEFEAEKDGYYLFNYLLDEIIDFVVFEKNSTGKYEAEDSLEYEYLMFRDENTANSDLENHLYLLEEGTYIVMIDKWDENIESAKITAEYEGAELTGFDFEGGVKFNLIPNYNIGWWEEDNGDRIYELDPGKTTLTFDSGKSYDVYLYSLDFRYDGDITEGEYDITVEFGCKNFEKTISVYDITHDVKSIEVKNFDKYDTVKKFYDGCLNYDFTGLEFVIEFANGKKETIVSDGYNMMGIDLQNGNPAYIFLIYDYETDENGNVYFSIRLSDHEFVNLPVKAEDATKSENAMHLSQENINVIRDEFYSLKWSFEDIFTIWEITELPYVISYFFRNLFTVIPDIIGGIMGNIGKFAA